MRWTERIERVHRLQIHTKYQSHTLQATQNVRDIGFAHVEYISISQGIGFEGAN